MALKAILVLAILLTIFSKIAQGKESERDENGLTAHQREIIQKYEAIATLSYGEKCNFKLESKGDTVRDYIKTSFTTLLKAALKQQFDEKDESEPELSPSGNVTEEFFAELEDFTAKVERYQFGLNRICNDTKYLYCDQDIGKCQCGKAKKLKGFNFVHVDGVCKLDVGSGCAEMSFSDSDIGCRDGSTCVTIIENKECIGENVVIEVISDPRGYIKIEELKGYSCFCGNVSFPPSYIV